MKDLAAVSNQLKSNNSNALTASVSAFHEEIVQAPVNSTIPEQVFLEYFLDFFRSGMVNDSNNILGIKWVELAKSPFNYVDVIDNTGAFLFQVPPMILKPDLTGMPINDVNFGKMAATYELKNNRLPTDANNYLANQLNGLSNQITSPNEGIVRKQWEYIFNRYSVQQPTTPELPDTTSKAVTKDASMDGMIDYD